MPKRTQNRKPAVDPVVSEPPTQPTPPLATEEGALTDAELKELGFYDDQPDEFPGLYTETLEERDPDFWKGRREVWRLPNGVIVIARNEIESMAFSHPNYAAKLVDVVYDDK